MTSRFGAWFSTPNTAGMEIVAALGYDTVVFDAEHGTFDLAELDVIVPFAKALGLTVLVKAAAPERVPIQQALDFGADGVVIPHVLDAEHAALVCGFAKLPPLGDRSLAGGRTMGYAGFDAGWADRHNTGTLCLPMIEDPVALDDIDAILALETVDGIFIGPGDLFARRGGGGYRFEEFEAATITRLARAAKAAGKPWLMPAWGAVEQQLAVDEEADTVFVMQEFAALRTAFAGALERARGLQA